MASSAVIGALRVVLGMDTASWEESLGKAQGDLTKWASKGALAGAAVAGALTGAAAAFGHSMLKAVDYMDDLNDASQRVGMPTEQLSTLEYAAEASGVSVEGLRTALTKLDQSMAKAAGGGAKAAAGYNALHVAVKNSDGTLRSNSDVLNDVADRFAGMQDGAGKTAIAMQIFGRAGADLIPMLNSGSAGIKDMTDEARAFGLEVKTGAGQAADEFNDNLLRLKKMKEGLVITMTAALMPALISISNGMVQGAKNSRAMEVTAQVLAGTLKVLASAGIGVATLFAALGSVVGTAAAAVMAAAHNDWNGAWKIIKSGALDVAAVNKQAGDMIVGIWTKGVPKQIERAMGRGQPPIVEAGKATNKAADAAKEAAEKLKRAMEQLQGDTDRVLEGIETSSERAMRVYRADVETLDKALAKGLINVAAYTQALERLQTRRDNALMGKIDLIKTPDIGNLDRPWEDAARGIQESADETRDRFREAFGDAFATGVRAAANGDFKGWLSSMFSQVADNALRNIGNALGGWIGKMGQAGGAGGGAGGLGGILKSASSFLKFIPGFAGGGSFTVGGRRGTDANLAVMRVTKGERVDITAANDRGGAGQTFIINAQGAVLAEGLISEMQTIGVRAAYAGGEIGERRTTRTLQRRQSRRLGA